MARIPTSGFRAFLLLLLYGGLSARAATPFTEGFSGGLSNWSNSGAVAWSSVSNVLKVVLPAAPLPLHVFLMGGPAASGGAFVGNYPAADIALIGFSFRVDNALPGVVDFRWQGGGQAFFQNLTARVAQTGVWYRFAFSLNSMADGGWASGGSELDFQNGLLAVDSVSLQVTGRADVPITCYLDDMFVDRLPAASRIQATTNGYGELTWQYVHSNYTYQLEYVDALTGIWSNAAVVTSPSTNLVIQVPWTNAPSRAYRLQLP